jgi:hypothetical protein
MSKKVFTADEPTLEELNEMIKYYYQELIFRAILIDQDEHKAKKYLSKLSNDQLQVLDYACNWICRLSRQIF